jgi:hypothetical protein
MSSTRRGILRDITEQSVAWLQTRADFSGVPILAKYQGDIETIISDALNRTGLYIYVWPCIPTRINPNIPGLRFDELRWRAEVGEDPTLNQTGITAEYAAERVLLHMLAWEPTGIPGLQQFFPANDAIAEADDDINSYILTLTAQGGVQAQQP